MTTRRSRKIEVGDTVRSQGGRLYRVDEVMVPASGGHYRANRVYGVTDKQTGLVNAFYGDEIELESKARS
jgi:hypothetical protein